MQRLTRNKPGIKLALLAAVWFATPASVTVGQDDATELQRLSRLSLEDLMSMTVSSLDGVDREWFKTPASTFVVTNEDIRRSGVQSLAEAMRLAPGVFVAQSGSSRWMVGTRGFNGALANKTLVLIDGRAVYDPLFGGTFWDVQDVLLEDVDRIEVIRGPGPTLWGANAVNGVFNVVSRGAKETQGLYVTALAGTHEQGMGALRYGGAIDDDTWFRLWGKYQDFRGIETFNPVAGMGDTNVDDWNLANGGFRVDRDGADGAKLMLDAGVYSSGRIGEWLGTPLILTIPFVPSRLLQADGRADGGHLLAKITQDDRETGNGWSIQAYYDRTHRNTYDGLDVTRHTGDIEFRSHFKLMGWQEILWGLGLRYSSDESKPGAMHLLDPSSRDLVTFSGFIQDTLTIVPDRLFAMVGTKLEHTTYTGLEVEPSGRLWWTPDNQQTLWGSISRAVREPSRLEHDGTTAFAYVDAGLLGGGPVSGVLLPIGVTGNPDADAEVVMAYEAGYRRKITENLSVDLSLFYNDYDKLLFLPTAVLGAFTTGTAQTYGGELSTTWHAADNWRLQAGYSFTKVQIHGPLLNQDEGNTPQNMVQLRSYYNITKDLELNAAAYYADSVPAEGNPAYIRLDVGVTWRVTDRLEIACWGQNLLDPRHSEYTDPLHTGRPAEVPRAFYVQATLRF